MNCEKKLKNKLIQSALRYASYGWYVLPVDGKVPSLGNDWPSKATIDPSVIESMFASATGVGVMLGPKSNLVDVECDSEDAAKNLRSMLGFYIGVSFLSQRGTHFLFRWSERFPAKTVFKINGIEFRIGSGKACQSVFPPSAARTWIVEPAIDSLCEFPAMDELLEKYSELHKRKEFKAVPNVRGPMYGDSETLDVPKWLAKHGREIIGKMQSSDGTTRWFIECPGIDKHTTNNSYRDCCVTQESSGRLGGQCFHQSCGMTDWDALRSAIGELEHSDFHETVESTEWIDFSNFMNDKPKADDPKTKEKQAKKSPIDPDQMTDAFYKIPGIIEEFINYAVSTAPRPRPELALACAISLVGVITGRKIQSKSGLRTNCYMIGLAPSGSGKDWARNCCRNLLANAGQQDLLASENPASGAALVTAISEQPSSLFQIDEINRYFASIKSAGSRSPYLCEVFDILMKLNDQCHNPAWSPKGYGESKKNKTVAYPHCCIFGTGTPEGFWNSVKSSDATDGFLARMLIIEADKEYPRKVQAEWKHAPIQLVDRVREWCAWFGGAGNLKDAIPQAQTIPFDSAAVDRLWSHSEGIEDRLQSETVEQKTIWSRTSATAEKLAMIFACSRGPQELIVTLDDANAAVRLANWTTRLLIRRVFSHVSENDGESKKKRVLAIISEGEISKSDLTRRTQWLEKRDRNFILDDLMEGEFIEMALGERSENGRVPTIFRAVSQDLNSRNHGR